MKNNKFFKPLSFAFLLLFSVNIFAERIKLDDIKVGATVTREGIDLGWGDYLPVPDGEWEVVVREDGEYKGYGPFEHSPVIYITLLNKNTNSDLRLLRIDTFLEFKNRMSPNIPCPNSNWVLKSDQLGTVKGQNLQLCKAIYKPKPYKSIFEWRPTPYTKIKLSEIDFLSKELNDPNPIITTLVLAGGKKGNYPINYFIGIKQDIDVSILDNWLNTNILKIKDYHEGKQVIFTDLSK